MPKKHDPKKNFGHRRSKKKIYIVISPCPHVIQIKGREIHKKEYSISTNHLPHMCKILINLCDLSSPWIHCLILQYMWRKCMLSFLLPWAPYKLSLEVGWKQAMLWWGHINNERHERSYGEVKLWLVFVNKYFQNPSHIAGKWRRLKSTSFHSSTSQAIHGRHIKIHG